MKEIPLTRGKVALVDDGDFETVNQFKWYAENKKRSWYAARCVISASGKKQSVYMHQFIGNAPVGFEIDHINGNGLDNRRQNLRQATKRQQQHNCRKALTRNGKKLSSSFKGVSVFRRDHKWQASIHVAGITKSLGLYLTEEAAAHVYDQAAQHYFGPFARTNFPQVEIHSKPTAPFYAVEVRLSCRRIQTMSKARATR